MHNRYVIAANRDEFRARPTASIGYLGLEKNVLGGQDLQAGGMWLGVCRGGKFAAITNYRDRTGTIAGLPSRGEIVADYLGSKNSAVHAIELLVEKAQKYAGFNVFFGDSTDLVFYSNKQNEIQILQPGFYGLSNHLLDSPWPKVVRGKKLLRPYMCDCEGVVVTAITALMQDTNIPDDAQLPDTGVGLGWERFLAPIFIDGIEYGTRSTAVIEIGNQGGVFFTETTYIRDADGNNISSEKQMGFCTNR